MWNIQIVAIATVFLILIAANEVNSLKCWVCSTTAIDGAFCRDPFEPDKLSPLQKEMSYKECLPSVTPGIRGVCKKLEQRINDNLVIQRSCYFEDKNDTEDKCSRDPTPRNVRTLSCGTCTVDGCNSAMAFTWTSSYLIPAAVFSIFYTLNFM